MAFLWGRRDSKSGWRVAVLIFLIRMSFSSTTWIWGRGSGGPVLVGRRTRMSITTTMDTKMKITTKSRKWIPRPLLNTKNMFSKLRWGRYGRPGQEAFPMCSFRLKSWRSIARDFSDRPNPRQHLESSARPRQYPYRCQCPQLHRHRRTA